MDERNAIALMLQIDTSTERENAEIPNEETRQAIENAGNGIGLKGPFNSVDEVMKDLESDED